MLVSYRGEKITVHINKDIFVPEPCVKYAHLITSYVLCSEARGLAVRPLHP
jgi:hypothetical protein